MYINFLGFWRPHTHTLNHLAKSPGLKKKTQGYKSTCTPLSSQMNGGNVLLMIRVLTDSRLNLHLHIKIKGLLKAVLGRWYLFSLASGSRLRLPLKVYRLRLPLKVYRLRHPMGAIFSWFYRLRLQLPIIFFQLPLKGPDSPLQLPKTGNKPQKPINTQESTALTETDLSHLSIFLIILSFSLLHIYSL